MGWINMDTVRVDLPLGDTRENQTIPFEKKFIYEKWQFHGELIYYITSGITMKWLYE